MKHLVVASLLCSLFSGIAYAADVKDEQAPIFRRWIQRPWEVQRLVYLVDSWSTVHSWAMESNTKRGVDRWGYPFGLSWEAVFKPLNEIRKADSLPIESPLTAVVIEFDHDGKVLTPNDDPRQLRGRLTEMETLVLSTGDAKQDNQYRMADWFLGRGDASTHWAQGFCFDHHVPNRAGIRDEMYIYGKYFKAEAGSTTFGCREWAYQLYDKERPYIDVTSYVPKDESWTHGTYIRNFIGWFRFDEHKPVIGKDEDKWYCLLDCPDGEQPGLIPDIRAWAKRHGWAIPKRPTKSPTFPDPPAKSGTYPR